MMWFRFSIILSLQLKYILTASVMTVVQYMPVLMMSHSLSTLLQCLASPVRVAVQLTSLDSYPSVNAVKVAMRAVVTLLHWP